MSYLQRAGALAPKGQMEKDRADQVQNNADGFVFEASKWERLNRFLVLGTEGNTHYQGERELTAQNVESASACIRENGIRVVQTLAEVSTAGRAPKNDQAILVLAMCTAAEDPKVRAAALDVLPIVCRTGTHLFMFLEFVQQTRGWGRALKRAVAEWYTDKSPEQVAYQAIKYRQRNGWTHADALRLSKPRSRPAELSPVFDFIVGKLADGTVVEDDRAAELIQGYTNAQQCETPAQTAAIAMQYDLPREALNPDHLSSPEVWAALLAKGMPLTAMIRNLGNMSKVGLLAPMTPAEAVVCEALRDSDALRNARVHPLAILLAMATYQSGHGFRGTGEWPVDGNVVDALNDAFYLAFANVEPTGKRTMIAVDISGSMHAGGIAGTNLSPMAGAAALALVTKAVEPNSAIYKFGSGFTSWDISPRQRLDDVIASTVRMPMDRTDCAQPMLGALRDGLEIDTFVIITDNETWVGNVHPYRALIDYRKKTGIDARLAVIGMTATGFSIADPTDPGMLDFVGMDTSTPEALRQFSLGLI